MTRILIAEDEAGIASFLQRGFEAEGFVAKVAESGDLALALGRSGEFDLLILDLGLPEMDGLAVLQELRKHDRNLPVVILTARDSVADTVMGLDTGADDYVTKPFHFDELLARVRARLRPERTPDAQILEAAGISLDLRTRRAFVDGRMVELSAREFAMARLFFEHAGQVLSKEQILSHVWGYDFDPGSNIVEVYVSYLRKKLGPSRPRTVRGMGYVLDRDA